MSPTAVNVRVVNQSVKECQDGRAKVLLVLHRFSQGRGVVQHDHDHDSHHAMGRRQVAGHRSECREQNPRTFSGRSGAGPTVTPARSRSSARTCGKSPRNVTAAPVLLSGSPRAGRRRRCRRDAWRRSRSCWSSRSPYRARALPATDDEDRVDEGDLVQVEPRRRDDGPAEPQRTVAADQCTVDQLERHASSLVDLGALTAGDAALGRAGRRSGRTTASRPTGGCGRAVSACWAGRGAVVDPTANSCDALSAPAAP